MPDFMDNVQDKPGAVKPDIIPVILCQPEAVGLAAGEVEARGEGGDGLTPWPPLRLRGEADEVSTVVVKEPSSAGEAEPKLLRYGSGVRGVGSFKLRLGPNLE